MKKYKYKRTFHLPWSLGVTSDDKVLRNVDHFIGKNILVTEKRDGENTSLYRDYNHARSLDSTDHESRHWLKSFWSTIRYDIPEDMRICGENMYAKHSIAYNNLTTYFEAFSVWNNEICLSWEDTKEWCELLNIKTVPVLYEGIFDEKILIELSKSIDTNKIEGYVVRLSDSFNYEDFGVSVAKFVRKGHVQTEDHWMYQEIVINGLKGE